MDQALSGTQALRARAPTVSGTPLGEPITNQASALLKAEDPLTWHLRYWLNLGTIGNVIGAEAILMQVIINEELHKIADRAFQTQIQNAWYQFVLYNRGEFIRHWRQRTLESDEAKAYIRDLARLVGNKRLKMRSTLRDLGSRMNIDIRDGDMREI